LSLRPYPLDLELGQLHLVREEVRVVVQDIHLDHPVHHQSHNRQREAIHQGPPGLTSTGWKLVILFLRELLRAGQ
jgi:hypothetical protein